MTRSSLPVLAAAAVAAAALASPSPAAAETFCVSGPAGCSGTAVSSFGLRQALLSAQSNGTADRFVLAPGEYAATGFAHTSSEPVQIIGSGADRTTLRTLSSPDGVAITGSLQSSISGVRVAREQDAAASALTLGGAHARDVIVEAIGTPVDQAVSLAGGATLDRARISAGGAARGVLAAGGETAVRDTSMQATFGIVARSGGTTRVERVAIGATISFTASRAGTVTLRFARIRRGGRLMAIRAAIKVKAKPGVNRARFTGRLSPSVRLGTGRYRMTARLSGQRTAPARARLTVLPRRR